MGSVWRALAGLAAAAVLACVGEAQVKPGVWEAIEVAHVEVNDKVDPTGALYQSPDKRMTLIVSGRIGDLILFDVPTLSLHRVSGGEVRFGEGAVLIPDTLRADRIGTYAIQDSMPAFRVDSLFVRLLPKRPLVGVVTPDTLLRNSPEWELESRFYAPYPQAINALKALSEPTEILAVFSVSCGQCRARVPRLMRVVADAGNPNLTARYLAVTGWVDSTTERYHVRFLPTFIVMRQGKEVGRIVERPRSSVEEDLVAILRGMY